MIGPFPGCISDSNLKVFSGRIHNETLFGCNMDFRADWAERTGRSKMIIIHPYPRDESASKFICDHCQKSFSSQSNLDRHVKGLESGRQVFSCDIEGCTNGPYKTLADLNRHTDIKHSHGFEGPVCPDCGTVFTRTCALNKHKKSGNCRQTSADPQPEDG